MAQFLDIRVQQSYILAQEHSISSQASNMHQNLSGCSIPIWSRFPRPIAPQPLVDLVRNGDDRAAEMITRSVYRESKFPLPPLDCANTTPHVFRDLFPRIENWRVHLGND